MPSLDQMRRAMVADALNSVDVIAGLAHPITARHRINFARGVPAIEAFPTRQLISATQRTVTEIGAEALQYGPARGPHRLLSWVARTHGVAIDRVMAGNGSMGLFDLLCGAVLQPGDPVMVEQPCYDRAIAILRRHRADIHAIAVSPDGADIEQMAAILRKVRPKLFYCVPDFQNPLGIAYPMENRAPGRAIGTAFVNPDIDLIGEAFGFEITRLQSIGDLEQVRQLTFGQKPQFIVVETSSAALLPQKLADLKAAG